MNRLTDKLRLIYIPFLLIAAGFILAYTFLHWALIIEGGISVKEDLVKFWLPFGLPFIPILIWLRPRIMLLDFKNDNAYFGCQFLACLAIAVPTIIAQEYLVTATGKLTALDRISQLEGSRLTKYYTVRNVYIDKEHIAVQNTATVTGRHNEDFNMFIYVAMPLSDSEPGLYGSETKYWLGKKYEERISNRLSDQEKNDRYKAFAERSQREFERADFGDFSYLEVLGNTEDHDEFNNALTNAGQTNTGDHLLLVARNEPFEARNGQKPAWILGSLGIGLLLLFVLLFFSKLQEADLEKFKRGELENGTDWNEMLQFFIPKEDFFVTPIIIDINLLLFILMVFAGLGVATFKGQDLLSWGANYGPLTTGGQWWRLLTSTFLHGGIMHLMANMYGLIFVGIILEPLLGRTRFALVYLGTGILASLASIWWYEATVSVGASGAIFGLYGFFLACLLRKIFPPDFGKVFLFSTLIFVGFNLLMGFTGGIDNAAHIGGLASGFIIGLLMAGQLKRKIEEIDEG